MRYCNHLCLTDIQKHSSYFGITTEITLLLLSQHGFIPIERNLIDIARTRIGAPYKRGVPIEEAPDVFDCSSFVRWCYSQLGVWLPRRSIQQRSYGTKVQETQLSKGDLVFTRSYYNYPGEHPKDSVGHVGIYTDDHTVIHAKSGGVREEVLDEFIHHTERYRGACRILPASYEILQVPHNQLVETEDDIHWILYDICKLQ